MPGVEAVDLPPTPADPGRLASRLRAWAPSHHAIDNVVEWLEAPEVEAFDLGTEKVPRFGVVEVVAALHECVGEARLASRGGTYQDLVHDGGGPVAATIWYSHDVDEERFTPGPIVIRHVGDGGRWRLRGGAYCAGEPLLEVRCGGHDLNEKGAVRVFVGWLS